MLNYQRARYKTPARMAFKSEDVYTVREDRVDYQKSGKTEDIVIVTLRNGTEFELTDPDRKLFDEIIGHVRLNTDNGEGQAYPAVE